MDKIQHAYGWTDDVVLNLTLARAVQMKEAIEQREEIDRFHWRTMIDWHAKAINLINSNTVETEEGRKTLTNLTLGMSLVSGNKIGGDTTVKKSSNSKPQSKYRLRDGTEITKAEVRNYSYEELDHTDSDEELKNKARKGNSGRNIAQIMNGNF